MSAPTPDPRNPIPDSRDPLPDIPRRARWWPPLGPLFHYDLVTATRRGQHSVLRCAAALVLLLTLLVGYANHVRGFNALHPFAQLPDMDPREPQQFATWFMFACLAVQVAGVFLIAPLVVADAVARDRETRMLEFLFITELSDWEIVAGKLFSRLAFLAGALLAGLPVLAITQLFGGVDLSELALGYTGLLSCLFVVGALGMACSTSASTVVAATVAAYCAAAGYFAFFACCISGSLLSFHTHWSAIVIIVAINFTIGLTVLANSVAQLRPRSQRERRGTAKTAHAQPRTTLKLKPSRPPIHRQYPLPPVYDEHPLLWKELNQYAAAWRPESVRIALFGALILPVVAAIFLTGLLLLSEPTKAATTSETIERGIATLQSIARAIVSVLTVLLGSLAGIVALRHTTASVVREREQKTLASLLTLPVARDEILAAKWLGGFAGWCPVLISLGAVIEFGLITGGVSPTRTLILICDVAAPLAFLASLGLWLSVTTRTTLRANVTSIMCLLLVVGLPLLIANSIEATQSLYGRTEHWPEWIVTAALPPLAWVRTVVGWPEKHEDTPGDMTSIVCGAAAYALAGWLLWHMARRRFMR